MGMSENYVVILCINFVHPSMERLGQLIDDFVEFEPKDEQNLREHAQVIQT